MSIPQINIRVPQSVVDDIDHFAEIDRLTRSGWACIALTRAVAARKQANERPPAALLRDIITAGGLHPDRVRLIRHANGEIWGPFYAGQPSFDLRNWDDGATILTPGEAAEIVCQRLAGTPE